MVRRPALNLPLALLLAASGCAGPGATPDAAPEPMPAQAQAQAQAGQTRPAPDTRRTSLPQVPAGAVLPTGGDPFRDPNPLVPRARVPAPLPPGGDGGRTAEAIGALEGRVDLLSRRGWPYNDLLPVGVDPHP